jgi:glycosyltransferase involved in cell wall biosynthesis
MKVLHIASGDLWAGAEKALYTLAVALQESHQARVAAVILNPGTLAERLRSADVELLVLDESRQNIVQLTRAVSQWVTKIQPDIIHTHRLKENIIGGLAAAWHGIPSVRTQHGANEHAFGRFNLRKRLIHDVDFLTGRLLQNKIIAVSEPLAVGLRSSYGPKKVCVIANGIALDETPLPLQDKFQSPLRIGIVGRLVPVKRVDLFLQIAQKVLAQQTPESRPAFSVIGDGPLRQELEQLATDVGVDEQVAFVGHVDNAEAYISKLDALVICSDHEGLPMVALEAMKHNTLIVTHSIGGLPELLGHGRCGYVLDTQCVEGFADVLNNIIKRPADAAQITEKARHQLQDHYSSQAMAQQHLVVYQHAATTG